MSNRIKLMSILKKRGFTLVELLVVIGIVALLSAIGLVVYTSVLKQGRDSKRQSDLRTIQSGLEQYYSDQGFYPTQDPIPSKDNGLDTLLGNQALSQRFHSNIGNQTLSATPKVYINSLPQDPLASPQPRYRYEALPVECDNQITNRCITYCLYANLENTSISNLSGCADVSGYDFAVTPP